MSDAIVMNALAKTYPGGQRALNDLTLSVREGEIFGFLGPNGAGKTTTIKILLGLLSATSGDVRVLGGSPADPETRQQVGYLPEVANYYEFMNIRELLRFYGALCGMSAQDIRKRTEEMLELTGLTEHVRKPLKTYSKGMLQRAGIAQSLFHDPDLLILDEPTTGLDPLARIEVREVMRCLREAGKTVFFSSHELSEAETVCDRVGILKEGVLRWCGPTSEVVGTGERNLERVFLDIIGDGENRK
ncbi:MAG: ABC transporter ATP-binding protein [Candidatus Pacebacteria bacterium]|nr:ABC transporter ATP-binding protein [Candidatus Paceibacterota bacterium]